MSDDEILIEFSDEDIKEPGTKLDSSSDEDIEEPVLNSDDELKIEFSDSEIEIEPIDNLPLIKEKLCGPKKSKNVDAYTRNELIKMILDKKLATLEEIKSFQLQDLCEKLNLPYVEHGKVVKENTYGDCLKKKKSDLIDEHINYLRVNKGLTFNELNKMTKEELCDVIYRDKSPFVVPSDFKEENCGLYDVATLKRIAVNLKINISKLSTQEQLCREIYLHYLRKNNKYSIEENVSWDQSLESKCLVPLNVNLKLKEHQINVVKHMLTHRSLLAVHATGSGKTLTAVATINCMLAKYPNIRVVVITPLSLLENFRKAIKQFGLNINNPKFLSQVDIRSYDDFINQEKRRKTIDCKNTFFIIDEAHNFRSDVTIKDAQFKKGSKSFVVMKCAAQAFKVLLLTATPIVNSPIDLRNLYCMIEGIDPVNRPSLKLFKETYNEFLTKPCLMSYYEVSKEDFPTRIEIPIEETTLVMDDEYYEEYKKVELKEASDNLLNYFGSGINAHWFYHHLRMAINSLDRYKSPKVDWIINFIKEEYKANRKTIIFSNWKRAGMNLIRTRLDELSLSEKNDDLYAYISGHVSKDVREYIKEKFNSNKIKVLLISRAGGEGLDLKEVRNVVIMESNWNPSIEEQVIGRAIRYKSHERLPPEERNVKIFRLMLVKPSWADDDRLKSVDDILRNISNEKKMEIDSIMPIIKENSIEEKFCQHTFEGKIQSVNELESEFIPERYVEEKTLEQKQEEDVKKVERSKREVYIVPNLSSNIALKPSEVGIRLWKSLAGKGAVPESKKSKRKFKKGAVAVDEIMFESSDTEEMEGVPVKAPIKDIEFESEEEILKILESADDIVIEDISDPGYVSVNLEEEDEKYGIVEKAKNISESEEILISELESSDNEILKQENKPEFKVSDMSSDDIIIFDSDDEKNENSEVPIREIGRGNVQVVDGDILEADTKYIVHQVNTISLVPKGLSSQIFKKYPNANVYKRDIIRKTGTIIIKEPVINLVGQKYAGESNKTDDSYENRKKWFKKGLDEISVTPNIISVAFPYKIGSGLAGGKWEDYESMIYKFAKENPNIKVKIYRK